MPRDEAKQQAKAAPSNGEDDHAGFRSVVGVIRILRITTAHAANNAENGSRKRN